jgi:hypothetical protein
MRTADRNHPLMASGAGMSRGSAACRWSYGSDAACGSHVRGNWGDDTVRN